MKAVGYLRVSGHGQVEGHGFERQEKAVREYARKGRHRLVKVYREEGVSGTTGLEERPALSELLGSVLGNGVEVVLVERADRLARDLIEAELILREFRKAGIKVVSVESGTELTTAESENPSLALIRQVLGAVAQFEKCSLVLKLKVARDQVL